jgi:ferrochelatase
MDKIALIVVNFGGPRNLEEVEEFLKTLLTDEDVIRTPLPSFLQNYFFRKIAKKRSIKVREDYASIGGKSPIFEDTEWFARQIGQKLNRPTLTFHRYLKSTHSDFLENLKSLDAETFLVFPLFPQFSYATTGSIARWFSNHIQKSLLDKMKWIPSYALHSSYQEAFTKTAKEFLLENRLKEEETVLIFSAHGLPKSFIEKGDPYQKECEGSFASIASHFPKAKCLLSYQSQFGKAEWIKPATLDLVLHPEEWIEDKKQVVFLPLSFTSDHIETLFEIEQEYVAPLRRKQIAAYRCPALGRRDNWIEAAAEILESSRAVLASNLIRRN